MKRPSSPAQLALIDLSSGAPAAPSGKARRVSSWKQAQAVNNALRSAELLARLAAAAGGPGGAEGPHPADRPHPPHDAPHTAIEWRAEALAELFEAVQRAAASASQPDFLGGRRKAG